MNIHVSPSITSATAEPISQSDTFPRSALFEKVLSELPADEAVLIPLYEAYRAIEEALLSVRNKPRCGRAASDLIEDEQERACQYALAIGAKLSQLTSIKSFWAPIYLETMLSHHFYAGDEEVADARGVIEKFNALRIVEPASH